MGNRFRTRVASATGLALFAMGLGFAGAQGAEGGDTLVARPSSASTEQQIEHAEDVLSRGQAVCTRISTMNASAQREGDIVLIDCLNPIQAQCNANLASANERIGFLRGAVSARDAETVSHQFVMISHLGDAFDRHDAGLGVRRGRY